jgi:putative transposase
VEHVVAELSVPERRACRVLGQHRSTQRKPPSTPGDEAALTADIVALATRYGRYGYRRITALLREAGWAVNRKRVERIWRREGLKVPAKQPKKGRIWRNDGSCLRLRPEHPNHVWSYDFVEDRTHRPREADDPSRSAEGREALGGTDGSTACSMSSTSSPASAWSSEWA